MPYIPEELVAETKKLDVLTYLQNYEPDELVNLGNGTYTTKTHDSIRISNGLWNWFSRGIGGRNALDYLIKVKGYTFKDAVEIIINKTKIQTPFIYENNVIKEKKYKLVLPIKDNNCDKVKAYLISRGIDKEIIEECIKNNLIYQEKLYNNVVFVGYNKEKIPKYAFCRATNQTRIMREAKGSDKNYSFRLNTSSENKRVHFFESAIDLLSYATLMKIKKQKYNEENMVSLAGVCVSSVNKENIKIPSVIERYLEENTNITEIYLHFDNDEVGRKATENLHILLDKKYKVVNAPVPKGKDCNEYLCYVLGIKNFTNDIKENNLKKNKVLIR